MDLSKENLQEDMHMETECLDESSMEEEIGEDNSMDFLMEDLNNDVDIGKEFLEESFTDGTNDISNEQTDFTPINENMILKEKIKKLEKMYTKSEKLRHVMLKRYKRKIRSLQGEIFSLRKQISTITGNELDQIFNEDQVNLIYKKYKKIPKWYNDMFKKPYQLKFACGNSGYKELLQQNIPLPSLRTLRNKLENCKFESGNCEIVFNFLKYKVKPFQNENNKHCVIVLDEISISSNLCYDNATGSLVGNMTLPEHDQKEIVTHGLVFMLFGIGERWKQVIDYFLREGARTVQYTKQFCWIT